MRLPAALRHMVESYKHQVVGINPMGAHGPSGVPIFFHWTALVLLKRTREKVITMTRNGAYCDKASDGLGHVLCEFRTCYRPRRVAEVSRRDLSTPWLIAGPLVMYSIRLGILTSAVTQQSCVG
jgi:hypothetical protein